MKRSLKNIIMILAIILVGVLCYFTIKDIKETNTQNMQENSSQMTNNQGNPPTKPEENSNNSNSEPSAMPNGDNTENSNNSGSNNQGNLPTKPEENSNNNNSEPPAMPNGDNTENSNNSGSNNQGNPPTKPEENSNNNNSEPPAMPNGDNAENSNNSSIKIRTIHYIMFTIEALIISTCVIYLIMSKFNKISLKEVLNNNNKILIFVLVTILITIILTIAQIFIVKNTLKIENSSNKNNSQMLPGENMTFSSSDNVTKVGEIEVDGTSESLTEEYTTSESDKSVILVENGGNLEVDGAKIEKSGGDSSNTENSEFYGVNAGVLVTEKSTATIKNATISTNAKGSNAVFSTGTDSKIYISDSNITTTGTGSSRGLDATYGGYIEAENVNITTQGGSCATLATDRGEGTVIANNSKLETNGAGSPLIYSTGNISVDNTQGTSNGSQIVVIEGKNTATVTNSKLTASGKGNRGNVDQAGIMIYQSMSGDAGEGTGIFTAKNSELSIQESSEYYKTTPMFFITNTDAVINLTNCNLKFGSNILISSKGTSEWGKSDSNGGNVTLNAENQTLTGNIEIDKISTLNMNLSNSSYTGTINKDNEAKEITLKLDSNSKITLTGDSYITSLDDEDTDYSNINFNGYKLYVNGTAINK